MNQEEYQKIAVANTWLYDSRPGSDITAFLYLSKSAGKSRKLTACVYAGNFDIDNLVMKKFSAKYGIDNFKPEMKHDDA